MATIGSKEAAAGHLVGRPVRLSALVVAATLVTAGCATFAVSGASPEPGTSPSHPAVTGCASPQVSANLATIEELEAAFGSAGIPSAEKWAEEVEEYRPYPQDPNWAKLSKELGKYSIAPSVLSAIISCLKP